MLIYVLSRSMENTEGEYGRFRLVHWEGSFQNVYNLFGLHVHSPDRAELPEILALHCSEFEYDVGRMVRFILEVRQFAPWVVMIALIDGSDQESFGELPQS